MNQSWLLIFEMWPYENALIDNQSYLKTHLLICLSLLLSLCLPLCLPLHSAKNILRIIKTTASSFSLRFAPGNVFASGNRKCHQTNIWTHFYATIFKDIHLLRKTAFMNGSHCKQLILSAYEVKNNCCLFESKEEWCFPSLNTFFRSREIYVFVLCKWGKWWRHRWFHLNSKTPIQEYL